MLAYFGLVTPSGPLDLPNPAIGVVFYVMTILHDKIPFLSMRIKRALMFLAASFAGVMSVWLAYVLRVVLEDFCVVCTASYIINAVILFLSADMFFRSEALSAAAVHTGKKAL